MKFSVQRVKDIDIRMNTFICGAFQTVSERGGGVDVIYNISKILSLRGHWMLVITLFMCHYVESCGHPHAAVLWPDRATE